jgi:hypothetical protein
MNVIFAAIIGGFSLGQAGPNFGYFATGRTAGYRLFTVIDRKPEIDLDAEGLIPSTAMRVRALAQLKQTLFALCLARYFVCMNICIAFGR